MAQFDHSLRGVAFRVSMPNSRYGRLRPVTAAMAMMAAIIRRPCRHESSRHHLGQRRDAVALLCEDDTSNLRTSGGGSADERGDVGEQLVLDLQVPGGVRDVDHEKQVRDEQRLNGRDP